LTISRGQVVFSKAGRDAGKKFIIIGIVDELNVLISDGELRKIEKPKKKKTKHIELTGDVIDSIKIKLEKKIKLSNSEIRKNLINIKNNNESI
jgi:ribosomal protein L14E/L6E/L27E